MNAVLKELPSTEFLPNRKGHVYSAIASVQAELSKVGVGKNGKNTQQGFKFRAWDDVQQVLSPILSKHQVFVVPRIIERECAERQTKSGSNQYHVVLKGEVQFVSGVDGSTFAYPCMGESMDTGDKATSKAITMLMKYGLLHGLQIPLEGAHDADAETPEETQPARITPTGGAWEAMDADQQNGLLVIAEHVVGILADNRPEDAVGYIEDQRLTNDEKVALWTRFSSQERSAMKKAADKLKKAKEAANGV